MNSTHLPKARLRRNPSLAQCCALLCVASWHGIHAQTHQDHADKPSNANAIRAEQEYLAGARLLDGQKLAEAQAQFTHAVELDPTRPDYQLALMLTREQRVSQLVQQAAEARLLNRIEEADALIAQARQIDPQSELVREHTEDPAPAQPLVPHPEIRTSDPNALAPPIEVQPAIGPRDLHFRGDVRSVLREVAAAYGLRTTFDDSVTAVPLRFDLDHISYADAMPILLQMAHVFAVAVDPTTLLIAKDTAENREKFERQVQETIYIPASTVEQLNEISNIVKNVFDVKQLTISPGSGTVALRAPQPTLKAVNYTIADMLDGGSEVMLDLKLISIDKHIDRNIGFSPPTQLNAFSAAGELQSFVSANQSTIATAISQGALVPTGSSFQQLVQEAAFLILSGLATDVKLANILTFFGNGLTLFGVSLGSGGTFNLGLNSSEARALDDIKVRVGDHQTTTLRIGSKYPITTATYSSGVTSATAAALAGKSINGVSASSLLSQYLGSASTATVPLVQFEDLGITLKTTPTVMRSGLISMHIDMKIEGLTGASSNNIPVLSSRSFTSDMTVQEGTTAVILSELSGSESASVSGFPGLASLPGFQQTISDDLKAHDSSELLLMVTPHLVRRRSASMASRPYIFRTSVPGDY